MKREERQQLIVNLLVENKTVDLDDLADRFTVSKMTIHRDLDDLEQAGVLRKVRGGATIDAGTQFESDFRIRERQGSEAKLAMAETALELANAEVAFKLRSGINGRAAANLAQDARLLEIVEIAMDRHF